MQPHTTLTYSQHAEARLRARGVFKKQVRRTLRRPDTRYVRGQDHIAEYTTSASGLIRVVYRPVTADREQQVVSVIRLGKLKGAAQTAATGTVYDPLFDVAYVALVQGRITETTEVAEGIYYDLDAYGEIVGVEIFAYSRYAAKSDDGLRVLERLPIASF